MLNKNEYEEIADISETIADGIVIDGEANFEDDSIVEVDLKDFEELGAVDTQSFKSSTIIDEFENMNAEKNTFPIDDMIIKDKKSSINIQKLSIQIDGLTRVKKHLNVKKHTDKVIPSKDIFPPVKEEKKGYATERLKSEQIKSERYEEISPGKKELEQKAISEIKDIIKEIIKQEFEKREQERKQEQEERLQSKELFEERAGQEFAKLDVSGEHRQEEILEREEIKDDFQETILKQYEEIEKKYEDDIVKTSGIEIAPDEINKDIDIEFPEDTISQDLPESPGNEQGNTFTIEIPDKLLGELPADFNIDEFGKIDLNEAETIAEEDFHSLAKGDLLEELEELDILPEQDKNDHIRDEVMKPDKPEQIKEVLVNEVKKKEKTESKEIKETEVKDRKDREHGKEEINKEYSISDNKEAAEEQIKPVRIKPKEIIIDVEDKQEKKDKSDKIKIENKDQINLNTGIKGDNQSLQKNPGAEIKDENVLIFDSENISTEYPNLYIPVDELENISSSIVDVVEGEAKQLSESETTDRKAITGLIRDNYPTFKDLLKEKDLEEQHIHFDDDIAFVDNSFIEKDQTYKSAKLQSPPEDAAQSKTVPYEQILGLIPDEIELIEDQLFKIKGREIDLEKAENIYYDQHTEDSLTLEKFKYILPVPDSLLDDEKKSIEDEISAKSALIFEEDVDKIKKKLEDSMEKKIKETIEDITGKITIYEDNKKKNKTDSISIEKKDIKRLLKYLDELLESLPEKSIDKFANSDYYELYKKVLKDLDI